MTPMQVAIDLAQQAQGTTSPNPTVGAVVVKDGNVVGRGYTLPPGGHHAEIVALREAGDAARGATLYTTLEPCCVHGRTPPCTGTIIAAEIRSVNVAVIDPNPQVSGRGCVELEGAGIQVSVGEESEAARELCESFAKHVVTKLPFVTAKYAMSMDGKIATHWGDSHWVTGAEARSFVQQMRRHTDAVLVGVNTVMADDPQLTARDDDDSPLPRQPLRVVLDSQARTPPRSRMLEEPGHTVIVVLAGAPQQRVTALTRAGAEVLKVGSSLDGRVDLPEVLAELGRRDVVSLLVEAGGTVQGSLFDARLVDKVYAFIAPLIVGGAEAASPVEGTGVAQMADAWRLDRVRVQQVGDDWLVVGYPRGVS